MKNEKIPVTILTGFLGAGKTTLLNELIGKYPDKKFAIIENEFGDIGIDNELVIGADDGIFEMSNGCICCTLNDELLQTLLKLLGSEHDFNHLIIETTGIAEPGGVAAAFVVEPAIQAHFQLDATICLVDANHIEDVLQDREEAKRQVTFADYIIINKKSAISAEHLPKIEHLLREANPFATIESTDYAKVNVDILNLRAYTTKSVEAKINEMQKQAETQHHHEHSHDHSHDHNHKHQHQEHKHHHHSDIVTHAFVFEEPLDMLKFRHWVTVLLLLQGQGIYRIKGILHFQFNEHKVVFQSVQKMHVFQPGEAWGADEKRQSKIVFIGKELRQDILAKNLKQCLGQAME